MISFQLFLISLWNLALCTYNTHLDSEWAHCRYPVTLHSWHYHFAPQNYNACDFFGFVIMLVKHFSFWLFFKIYVFFFKELYRIARRRERSFSPPMVVQSQLG